MQPNTLTGRERKVGKIYVNILKNKFTQDPQQDPDPKPTEKQDPDPDTHSKKSFQIHNTMATRIKQLFSVITLRCNL